MKKCIGRKIHVNFGDHLIAIEKYPINADLKDIFPILTSVKETHIFNIFEENGIIGEDYLGKSSYKKYGGDVNELCSTREYWLTNEEFKSLVNKE